MPTAQVLSYAYSCAYLLDQKKIGCPLSLSGSIRLPDALVGRHYTTVTPIRVDTLESRLRSLVGAGLVQWSGRELKPLSPVAKLRGEHTIAAMIVEDRR